MKKLYQSFTLLAFILLSNQIFAQKIEIIDYGLAYKNVREMTYYDFKDNSDGFIGNVRLTYLLKGYGLYNYPSSFVLSTFPQTIKSKKYINELIKLSKEFKDYGFSNGEKRAYNYMQLYLEKFEIISEYYKDLYNYSIEKVEESNKIVNKNKELEDSISSEKKIAKGKIENDSALKKLIADKGKSINKLNAEFANKIQQIELQKKNEIKALQITNYADNKRKIIAKYKPKISDLNKQKNDGIISAKQYWDDKIILRKNEIEKVIANDLAGLEKTKVQTQSSQRQEIKNENNLNQKREDIETDYQKAIAEINKKIKNSLK